MCLFVFGLVLRLVNGEPVLQQRKRPSKLVKKRLSRSSLQSTAYDDFSRDVSKLPPTLLSTIPVKLLGSHTMTINRGAS